MAANLPFAGCKPLFAGAVTFSKTRASQSKTLIWIGFYALRSARAYGRAEKDFYLSVPRTRKAVASRQLPVARKATPTGNLSRPGTAWARRGLSSCGLRNFSDPRRSVKSVAGQWRLPFTENRELRTENWEPRTENCLSCLSLRTGNWEPRTGNRELPF